MVLALFLLFGLYVGNIVIILYYIFGAVAIFLEAAVLSISANNFSAFERLWIFSSFGYLAHFVRIAASIPLSGKSQIHLKIKKSRNLHLQI